MTNFDKLLAKKLEKKEFKHYYDLALTRKKQGIRSTRKLTVVGESVPLLKQA